MTLNGWILILEKRSSSYLLGLSIDYKLYIEGFFLLLKPRLLLMIKKKLNINISTFNN